MLGVGCEREYPLEPTFCDHWCHATLRGDCSESATNCVRDCELTKASAPCFPLQEQLLSCYEDAPDDAFVCAGGEFRSENRVQDDVCLEQRDALFECESPGIITSCLTPCRTLQDLVPPQEIEQTADAGAACPLLTDSCESWCWSLLQFSNEQLEALGIDGADFSLDPTLSPVRPSNGADAGGAASDDPLAACRELLPLL